MTRSILAAGLAFAILGAAGAAAHTTQDGNLQVTHPWVAPAEQGATTEGHPTLTNTGDSALEITGASSDAAHAVHLMLDGQKVDRVTLAGGETLSPQRFRLRLQDLTVALPAGKAVPVELHLDGRDPVQLRMAIGQNTMNPQEMVEMQGGHHGGSEGGHHDE